MAYAEPNTAPQRAVYRIWRARATEYRFAEGLCRWAWPVSFTSDSSFFPLVYFSYLDTRISRRTIAWSYHRNWSRASCPPPIKDVCYLACFIFYFFFFTFFSISFITYFTGSIFQVCFSLLLFLSFNFYYMFSFSFHFP
jgi:hypothetical protein